MSSKKNKKTAQDETLETKETVEMPEVDAKKAPEQAPKATPIIHKKRVRVRKPHPKKLSNAVMCANPGLVRFG